MGYIKWMDNLSKVLKIVFCIFYLDLTWMVYRIIKFVQEKNWTMVVVWGLIAVFLGWIWWIVDLFLIMDAARQKNTEQVMQTLAFHF